MKWCDDDRDNARKIAALLGCIDIRELRDMTVKDCNETINQLKMDIRNVTDQKKKVFLFVYAAGHGIAGVYQEMVLNATSGNKYALERNLRDICNWAGNLAHVFCAFDMCKSEPSQYPGLTYKTKKQA